MTAPEDQLRLAAAVDAIFDCAQPTGLGPCAFPAGHDGGHVGLLPVTPLCRVCRGRGDVEDPNTGGDFMCWQCQGTGLAPEAAA